MTNFTPVLLLLVVSALATAWLPRRAGRAANQHPSQRAPQHPRSLRSFLRASVPASSECANAPVRNITGRCTSAVEPALGEFGRAQFSYFNIDSTDFRDEGLLSPRAISNILSAQPAATHNSRNLNELFVFFGQFVDHDFALSPLSDTRLDIEVPGDDPNLSVRSLPFKRSLRAPVSGSGRAERPINAASSALDLSNVYGLERHRNDFLRVPNSCRLQTSEGNNLPFNTEALVNSPSVSSSFYIAGDTRVNVHPVLTSIHTIFLREHNNICDLLKETLPDKDSQSLHEVARAINIAQYQKIVYEEWLPAILGRRLPLFTGYNSSVNPTVSVEFTIAGFRLGHTMVGNGVSRIDENGQRLPPITMEEMFFRDGSLADGDLENLIRGAARTSAEEVDTLVVDALRNFLFSNVPEETGFDLVALNLQRSRDHNVPRFNEFRRRFRGSPASSFTDIHPDPDVARKLEQAYGNVDNVEAWVGLMAEEKRGGAGLGPTNAALWTTEFLRLRDGDRFFYLDNRRHNQIPEDLLQIVPQLNMDIFSNRPIFQRILGRTTNLDQGDLSSDGSIFCV